MYYKLSFDMDRIDEAIENGENTIYAETTNIDEIEYDGVKKGFFDNIILSPDAINNWPEVKFFYSSKASKLESDYLLNVKRWPIIHIRVMDEFIKNGIEGVRYYPIKLIDVVTGKVNSNYVLMYVTDFIDAYDLEKSSYRYNEKYNFYSFIPTETYLNEKECAGHDVFRCCRSVASIYVSERVKAIVEKNKWIGFAFYQQQ